MFGIGLATKVYVAVGPTDMRKELRACTVWCGSDWALILWAAIYFYLPTRGERG